MLGLRAGNQHAAVDGQRDVAKALAPEYVRDGLARLAADHK